MNHHHSGASASNVNHQLYNTTVLSMQNSQASNLNNSSNQQRYLVGTAGAGGEYVLPEGHDENSDDEDSEPENHRE